MGLKQNQMQSHIGIKQTTWNGYEMEKSTPYLHVAIKISEYFGYSLGDLIDKDIENEMSIGNNFEKSKRIETFQKGNINGNLIGNNLNKKDSKNTHFSLNDGECNNCAYKDSLINEKNKTIEALTGQVNALKLATDQLIARLEGPEQLKKQAG